MFRAQPAMPAVEDHGNRMAFSLTVPGQVLQERLARRLKASGTSRGGHSGAAHKVIPIDKKMCCHLQLNGLRPFVDITINI